MQVSIPVSESGTGGAGRSVPGGENRAGPPSALVPQPGGEAADVARAPAASARVASVAGLRAGLKPATTGMPALSMPAAAAKAPSCSSARTFILTKFGLVV